MKCDPDSLHRLLGKGGKSIEHFQKEPEFNNNGCEAAVGKKSKVNLTKMKNSERRVTFFLFETLILPFAHHTQSAKAYLERFRNISHACNTTNLKKWKYLQFHLNIDSFVIFHIAVE